MLSGIRVIIWDFYGTLYPMNRDINRAMEEEQYRTIMRYKKCGKEEAEKIFWSVYPATTTSGNAAVGIICGIPTAQAARENEQNFNRLPYIQKDTKLIDLFKKLIGFSHYILGNGVKKKLEETVRRLGIPDGTFEEIVTSETVGVNKPDTAGFRYIMQKSGYHPGEHLMVGDREIVDLAPAKSLGIKTCLVTWGNAYPELTKIRDVSSSVDVFVSTVYDVAPLLL